MNNPLVSVIMPVYNAERFLAKAIDSVLNQTYTNFELIIVNDGSKDKSLKIITSYKDSRIRVISRGNKGVSASRNEAILAARGAFIAMHDADDISVETRFEKQVNYLANNPGIGLLGTNLQVINEDDEPQYIISLLTHPKDLKLGEIFSNQFGQGAVMLRREAVNKHRYNPKYEPAEDADLWRRISHTAKAVNLKEPLYLYRVHSAGASANLGMIRESAFKTTVREFKYYLAHKDQYRFSFHPFSMQGGIKTYLERKSAVYSRMSYMYSYSGYRRVALPVLLLAIIHAPWLKTNYSQLWATLQSRNKILNYRYEFF